MPGEHGERDDSEEDDDIGDTDDPEQLRGFPALQSRHHGWSVALFARRSNGKFAAV